MLTTRVTRAARRRGLKMWSDGLMELRLGISLKVTTQAIIIDGMPSSFSHPFLELLVYYNHCIICCLLPRLAAWHAMATSDSSPTSNTSVIQVITWFSLAAVLFSLAARAVVKVVTVKTVSLDDYLISLSVVRLICASVATRTTTF